MFFVVDLVFILVLVFVLVIILHVIVLFQLFLLFFRTFSSSFSFLGFRHFRCILTLIALSLAFLIL